MYCSSCGKEISVNDKYCRYCGSKNPFYKQIEIENESSTSKTINKQQNGNKEKKQITIDEASGIKNENKPVIKEKKQKLSYFKRHWRGQLSLGVSYWINTGLVNLIIFYGMYFSLRNLDYTNHPSLIAITAVLLMLLMYLTQTWAYVGLWRSANNHVKKYNKKFWPNIVQLLIIFSLFQLAYSTYAIWVPFAKENIKIAFNISDLPEYNIKILGNGEELEISGGIKFGLTNDVKQYFNDYPDIKIVRLNSIGGKIQEAHKLADFLKDKDIITYTTNHCYSACTDIFMAGKQRLLNENAELGFHQPTVKNIKTYNILAIDEEKKYFLEKGVNSNFVEEAFSTPNSDMWKPSQNELIKAGVVDFIVKNSYDGWQYNIEMPLFENPNFKKIFEVHNDKIVIKKKHMPDFKKFYTLATKRKPELQSIYNSYDDFSAALQDSTSAKGVYDNLLKVGISENALGNWDNFYGKVKTAYQTAQQKAEGVDKIYNGLLKTKKVTVNDIGTLDDFELALRDSITAKIVYDKLVDNGFSEDEIGTWDEFYTYNVLCPD